MIINHTSARKCAHPYMRKIEQYTSTIDIKSVKKIKEIFDTIQNFKFLVKYRSMRI